MRVRRDKRDFRDGALAGPTAWPLVREAAGSQCAASTGSHQGLAGQERPMLRAGQVELRARDEADVVVLHTELYADIATRVRAGSRPWLPIPAGSTASPYAPGEPVMMWRRFPWWNRPAASRPARRCGGPSTCITGWLIWECRCGPRSGAAA
jgi:hypothetical protein